MSGNVRIRVSFIIHTPTQNIDFDDRPHMRLFVRIQESSREVPAHCWSKKSENKQIERGNKDGFTLPVSLLPQGGTAQYQDSLSQPMISSTRKSENIE